MEAAMRLDAAIVVVTLVPEAAVVAAPLVNVQVDCCAVADFGPESDRLRLHHKYQEYRD
jgi:hypothetical protein